LEESERDCISGGGGYCGAFQSSEFRTLLLGIPNRARCCGVTVAAKKMGTSKIGARSVGDNKLPYVEPNRNACGNDIGGGKENRLKLLKEWKRRRQRTRVWLLYSGIFSRDFKGPKEDADRISEC